VDSSANNDVCYAKSAAYQGQAFAFFAVYPAVAAYDNPVTLSSELRYPGGVWSAGEKFIEELRKLSISTKKRKRVLHFSLYGTSAYRAFIEKICSGVGGLV